MHFYVPLLHKFWKSIDNQKMFSSKKTFFLAPKCITFFFKYRSSNKWFKIDTTIKSLAKTWVSWEKPGLACVFKKIWIHEFSRKMGFLNFERGILAFMWRVLSFFHGIFYESQETQVHPKTLWFSSWITKFEDLWRSRKRQVFPDFP